MSHKPYTRLQGLNRLLAHRRFHRLLAIIPRMGVNIP